MKMSSAATLVQPTGEIWKKIRLELNEDVNTREQYLAIIKDWLRKQPHLPSKWDDSCIMTFLRGCNFSLEKCKRKLDMYFTMKTACPEFFAKRDINRPELLYFKGKAQGAALPGLTPEGRRVTICRALDMDLKIENLVNAIKIALMVADIRLREEVEGISGDIFVLDASIVTLSHLAQVSPAFLKKFCICIQEAYPVKLKEVHIVNTSPVVDMIANIMKPFLKEKLRKRLFFHADVKELQEYMPIDMLPVEYGGNGWSLEDVNKAWFHKLQDYTEWFKEQESLKADESLRPGIPTNYDELFGIDGSFRQLSID